MSLLELLLKVIMLLFIKSRNLKPPALEYFCKSVCALQANAKNFKCNWHAVWLHSIIAKPHSFIDVAKPALVTEAADRIVFPLSCCPLPRAFLRPVQSWYCLCYSSVCYLEPYLSSSWHLMNHNSHVLRKKS